MKKLKNQSGQGLVEYLILVALMAVATMGVVRVLGQNVSAQFANITNKLQGGTAAKKQETLETVTGDHLKLKDMGNFMKDDSR